MQPVLPLSPAPPVPLRASRVSSAPAVARRQVEGELLVSVGPLGWTRVTCSVRHGVLTIGELSVNLKKAHVRLEESIGVFCIVVVPRPGSIVFPNVRLEPVQGDPEQRRAWFAALKGEESTVSVEVGDGMAFESVWSRDGPRCSEYKLKKRWFRKERSMKIKCASDNSTVFELVGKKNTWKSVELQDLDGVARLTAKECFSLPIVAYKVYAKYDDFVFLPWQRNLPLKKGRRCVAAVSRPWLARGGSYRAEVRFPRSCGAWLSEPDVEVEEEGKEFLLRFGGREAARVEVKAKGRYRAHLGDMFPEELLLLIVALIDKVVHDDVSTVSATKLLRQVRVVQVASAAKNSFVGKKVLEKAGY